MNYKHAPFAIVAVAAIICALIIRDGMIQGSSHTQAETVHPATTEVLRTETQTPSPFELVYPGQTAATLQKKADGHYWADAVINGGLYLEFMVDTGASICALTPEDAKKLGFDVNKLEQDIKIRTAGGTVYGASVTIDRLEIGRVVLEDVDAVVMDNALGQSLLGMSFLERLSRWEVSKQAIIIHQ